MNIPFKLLAALTVLAVAMAFPVQARNVTDPDAPRSLPEEGRIAVQWTDPAEFTDLRRSSNRWEARRGNWVQELARHLRRSAERTLPAGDRLEVTITDIDRAGDYEAGHDGQWNIRVMRSIYPPSMTLGFRHYNAAGEVVGEGERRLRDLDYLNQPMTATRNDALRYEKRMVDGWLRREFSAKD